MSVVELNKTNFDEKISQGKISVVDFWAPWCGYCVRMAPLYDTVADMLQGKADFYKVNTDENGELAQQFQIDVLPTFAVFKDGKLVDRVIGYKNVGELQDFIQQHL